jgi:hypothetical protein
MKTRNITVKLRDGEMGAYVAIPDREPAGAVIGPASTGPDVVGNTLRLQHDYQ